MANQKRVKDMKLMALDVGSKRMGIALWNPSAQLANPLMTLKRKTLKEDLTLLKSLIAEHQIEGILVGMPTSLAGNETESTQNAVFWVETLKNIVELPIYSFDESLSTRDALDILREQGIKTRSKTAMEKKDSIAAALFLEDFIRAQD